MTCILAGTRSGGESNIVCRGEGAVGHGPGERAGEDGVRMHAETRRPQRTPAGLRRQVTYRTCRTAPGAGTRRTGPEPTRTPISASSRREPVLARRPCGTAVGGHGVIYVRHGEDARRVVCPSEQETQRTGRFRFEKRNLLLAGDRLRFRQIALGRVEMAGNRWRRSHATGPRPARRPRRSAALAGAARNEIEQGRAGPGAPPAGRVRPRS